MALDFFAWWVGSLWGTGWLAFFGTAAIFFLIGLVSRMSMPLLASLMLLYLMVFGSGFFGASVWLIAVIISIIYLFTAFLTPGD